MFLLLRKLWCRRPRLNTGKRSCPKTRSIGTGTSALDTQTESHLPSITVTTTAPYSDTEQTVSQFAVLATTSTPSSPVPTGLSPYGTRRAQAEDLQLEEDESFYHLGSLITTSYTSLSNHSSTSSISTLASQPDFDNKRASSIINLDFEDLPTLNFPRSKYSKPRPGPTYSAIPPPFVQRSPAMRPRIRV